MGGSPAPPQDTQKPRKKRAAFDAAAGAVSGCIARFAVGPLDVLKIRFQVRCWAVMAAAKPQSLL